MRSKQKEAGGCLVGLGGIVGVFSSPHVENENREGGLLVLCHFGDC